jgi:hypothetical protein
VFGALDDRDLAVRFDERAGDIADVDEALAVIATRTTTSTSLVPSISNTIDATARCAPGAQAAQPAL